MGEIMRLFAGFVFAMLAQPAFAVENCDEWWFTRNLIYDRAGYCFASELGRAVFDNTGCIPGEAKLTPEELNTVAAIRQLEQQLECKVDTEGRSLNVPNIQARMQMIDIPVPDEYESGCYGWRGAPISLHAARRDNAPVTGMIEMGGDVYYAFTHVDGWDFIVMQNGSPAMGWMREVQMQPDSCEHSAG